jgi:hypothetical protein
VAARDAVGVSSALDGSDASVALDALDAEFVDVLAALAAAFALAFVPAAVAEA